MRRNVSLITAGIMATLALSMTSTGLATLQAQTTTQKTWVNTSACAYRGGGPYGRPVWAQHPAMVGLTCDPHDQIIAARWRYWGYATAHATAILVADNCNPSCATGRLSRYTVAVVASQIEHCGARRIYGKVTVYQTVAGHRRSFPGPEQGCF
jgi:hypothetical protein